MTAFTIAAAQSGSIKGDIAANVRRHAEFARIAAEHQCNVVVFPELSLTGYEPTIAAETATGADDSVLLPLQELANDSGIMMIAGCPIRSQTNRFFSEFSGQYPVGV